MTTTSAASVVSVVSVTSADSSPSAVSAAYAAGEKEKNIWFSGSLTIKTTKQIA